MAGLLVLHVRDDPSDVPRALAAAELVTTQEPMRVQIIVNGAAVNGLIAADNASKDIEPSDGVEIFACERALRGQHRTPEQLHEKVRTVPSAVIALASAQHEGAAYIRI